MVNAWFYDNLGGDQRLPHDSLPSSEVSLDKLASLGIIYWKLDPEKYENDPELEKIKTERGYSYTDLVTVHPDKLPNYDSKIKSFFQEHIHTDEEIRYVLEGSGYFDVRDKDDKWIRVLVERGDMIVLPAGIYHRFTVDSSNYAKVMRLFVGDPVWTPHNRPADDNPVRIQYVQQFLQASV